MSFQLLTIQTRSEETYPLDEFLNRLRNRQPGFQILSVILLEQGYGTVWGHWFRYQLLLWVGGRLITDDIKEFCLRLPKSE